MPGTLLELRSRVSIEGIDKGKRDLREFGDAADRAKKHTSEMGGGLSSLTKGFTSGLGAVTGFIAGFGGFQLVTGVLEGVKDQLLSVLDAGMSQQKVMAQTAAVIKSTGGVAHVSASQVNELADKMARLTGISDDQIQATENLLLTFTDIQGKTFPQTTKAVVDMAVAMHEDLQSAAIQVGKALQDPIAGATALRRVGVQLSDSQQELVKHFVETGQKAKAQQVILKELTREFGGSAEAAGKTLPGQLAILNVKLDQVKEKIGLAVIPILQSLLSKYVMPLADWLGDHLPAAVETLTRFLDTKLVPAIDAIINSPFVKTLEAWASAATDKLFPALAGDGKSVKTGAQTAKVKVDELRVAFHQAGVAADDPNFKTHIANAKDELGRMVDKLGVPGGNPKTQVIPALDAYSDRLYRTNKALVDVTAQQKSVNDQIPAWELGLMGLAGHWDELRTHIHDVINTLGDFKDTVGTRFAESAGIQQAILRGMSINLSGFGFDGKKIWHGIWDSLTGIAKGGIHSIEDVLTLGLDTITGIFTGKWDNWKKDWLKGEKNILNDLKQFVHGVQSILDGLPSWLKGASGGINPGIIFGPFANRRASGGPVSGNFLGAERGPELLLTPGIYHAPPSGGYVVNARDTAAMLSGGGGGGGSSVPLRSGSTYSITVYGADHNSAMQIARDVQRQLDRRDLLNRY